METEFYPVLSPINYRTSLLVLDLVIQGHIKGRLMYLCKICIVIIFCGIIKLIVLFSLLYQLLIESCLFIIFFQILLNQKW